MTQGLLQAVRSIEHKAQELPNQIAVLQKQVLELEEDLANKKTQSKTMLTKAQAKADELENFAAKRVELATKDKQEAEGILAASKKYAKDLETKEKKLSERQMELDIKLKLVDEKLKKLETVKAEL